MKPNKLFISLFLTSACFGAHAGQQIKPIEPIMVTIPAGSFDMGSTESESTQPIHTVSLPEFSLGKYEVTVKEFGQFIHATNYQAPTECRHELDGWFRPSSKGNWQTNALNTSEFQPVVCINWQAAKAYVDWLAKETGRPYRLPTEAEWEYAARAGTKTTYSFGDESKVNVCEYANTADLYGESILQRDRNTSYVNWSTGINNCSDGSAYASIVGMYKPNPFGLHDMLSNVLEFLQDCYVDNYQGAPVDGSARESENCERRATRGGSWHWNHWPLTNRGRIPVDFAGGVDGFRIALDGKAPSLSKKTKVFKNALLHAQNLEQKRRDLVAELPAKVENLVLNVEDGLVKLTWDKSSDEEVTGYRVYRNQIAGTMFKLRGMNIKGSEFVEPLVDNSYEYVVVAVKNHMQGEYSEQVKTPVGWTSIPGQVEAEWGETITGAAITMSSDGEGDFNLTGRDGIAKDAEMTYQINVPKAGHYELSYRVATPNEVNGFDVLLNDKKLATAAIDVTGGYHDWQTQTASKVYLPKGKHILKLKSLDSFWKLNWIALN
ncbi:SUMF1/EgtB/PvdO family nonheme iron enzyme [Thalassotalea sp. M1531]|uniref:SUMF1/EgtB/PvdO family nonheme iron enzyme n=1 Tax=Thalassotalea algicola TaxID=2716224 RepID=A0A7Y0Q780_9GAMM|nr:SUMF1/EgtB/PvdO family nonheme iron enzyme [Thalassotalea algicola]NMP31911.1 SUMF1/EgtB/PvdO family nonheme iron enzyme [Thalassotalea algicola]